MLKKGCSFSGSRTRTVNRFKPRLRLSIDDCQVQRLLGVELARIEEGAEDPLCLLHAGARHAQFESGDFNALLAELIERSASGGIIDLSGCVFPSGRGTHRIGPEGLFGVALPDDWHHGITEIHLSGAEIPGGLKVMGLRTKAVFYLDGIKTAEDIEITDCHLEAINLQNAKVGGSVFLNACRIKEDLSITGTEVGDALSIEGQTEVGRSLSIDRVRVYRDVTIQNSRIGYFAGKKATDDAEIVVDEQLDEEQTSVGNLIISNVDLSGALILGCPRIRGRLNLSDVKINGHLIVGGSEFPQDVQFENLQIEPQPARATSSLTRAQERARYRRELFVLQQAARRAGDVDAHTELVRLSRRIQARLGAAGPIRRIVWALHEFSSDSGGSWGWPVLFLALSHLMFASAFFIASNARGPVDALVLSTLNTFVPFIFSQTTLMPELAPVEMVLALAQCVISFGLIAALVIAIRTNRVLED